MRLSGTKTGSVNTYKGLGNQLYDLGGARPTLDLNFANNDSLADSITGKTLPTFTRASSGTYVDGDGLIKTSPVNLLTYSDYSQVEPTTDAQLEGIATAPDGTNTARRYSTPSAGLDTINKVISNGVVGNDYTFSVWVRSTGTASSAYIIVGDLQISSIVNISTTWQRFSITKLNNASSLVRAYVQTINVGDEIEVWGAQLEEGSTATDYIPTTSTISGAPRFDHDPATGESLGLLIEEARTNLMLNSGTTAEMVASNQTTRTSGGFTAPDGSTDASRVDLPEVADPNKTQIITEQFTGLATSTNYTASVYLKGLNGGEVVYLTFEPGTPTSFVTATLTTEWQRFDITGSTTSGILYFNVGVDTRSGTGQANQPAQSFYIWGAQTEQGSFPTSYIPTSGTTATRAADVARITGANFAKTNLLTYSEEFDQWTIAANSTVTPNAVTAPDGTLTADRVFFDTIGATNVRQDILLIQGQTYTFSVYAKAVTPGSNDQFVPYIDSPTPRTPSSPFVATSEWQRFVFTFTHTNSTATTGVYILNKDDVYVTDVYFWGAQLEEGSVLTDYTPSVESFVSRASSATYVDDATGLIKTTPVNLITRSEEFDNAAWNKSNGSVSANVETSPIGDQTADKWIPNTSNNFHFVKQTATSGSTQAFACSVYAKQAGYRYLLINTSGGSAAGNAGPVVDLQDGVVVDNFTATYSTSVTDAGNGWWRIAFSFTGNGAAIAVDHNPLPTSTVATYAGDGTSGVLLWGAQIEEGSTATPYIKTTSTISGAARYENGELLLEEARTNLVPYSSDLSASGWAKNGCTTSLSSESAPDGSFAYKYTCTGASNNLQESTLTPTQGSVATISFWAKNISATVAKVAVLNQNGNSWLVNPNSDDNNYISEINTDTWTRIERTFTVGNGAVAIYPTMRLLLGEEILIWGVQLEEGSYPTSYIPTSGTTVTRAADVSTSALGVDSFYNQDEGTWFAEAKSDDGVNGVFGVGSATGNVGGLNYDFNDFNAQWQGSVMNGTFNPVDGQFHKFAFTATKTSNTLASDGTQDGTGTATASLTATELGIGVRDSYGSGFSSNYLNGHIKRLAYFPTRLPDDKLKSITS